MNALRAAWDQLPAWRVSAKVFVMLSPKLDDHLPAGALAQAGHICTFLQQQLTGCLAVYLFGSQASHTATPQSDVDLAVLVPGYVGTERLWQLSCDLSEQIAQPVDLIDLRAASTVMQYQVLSTGRRLWQCDSTAALYEAFILSEKTALDEARQSLLSDIRKSGHVYHR
jgi:predicted nucleotidyltransferase